MKIWKYEKCENILICDISYKTSTDAKSLRIRYDKTDGFVKIHDESKSWLLFDSGWWDKICDRIGCFVSEKISIIDSINQNFARIRIDSYNSLPVEKILTFYVIINVILLINYYYNIFLEKGLYKYKSNKNVLKWIFVHYKCYIFIELTFLKELMLKKQVHQKSVIFVIIGIS